MRLITIFLTLILATSVRAEEKLKILVDIPATYHLVKYIVDDRADVEILLDPNFSAHHFSLSPSQVEQISEADYVLGIGSIFLPQVVDAARNVNPNIEQLQFYFDDYLEQGEGNVAVLENDPHFWLSPDHLLQMQSFYADVLRDEKGLVLADFNVGLSKGHAIFPQMSSRVENPVPLIASHQAYDYFERDFGVSSYGALSGLDDQKLPPRRYAEKLFYIENGDIKCLLMEAGEHSHNLEHFAEDNALTLLEFDLLGWEIIDSSQFFIEYFGQLTSLYADCQL